MRCGKYFFSHYLVGFRFKHLQITRMHSSRVLTARCSGRLRPHTPPLPCTPPTMHAPHHACPLQCTPPARHANLAMHAPHHACTPPTTHAPLPPCTSPMTRTPCNAHPHHTCPLQCIPPIMRTSAMHTPCHACPPATHAPSRLWTEFLTHACENITFPQLLLRAVIKW